jgi:hypothetical protein
MQPFNLFLLPLLLLQAASPLLAKRTLPTGNLIVAYVDNCNNNGQEALSEARAGVNVLIWSFISDLAIDNNGKPQIHFDLDPDCIAQVAQTLREERLQTTHLVSIGGWNAPHPNTTLTGGEWWNLWTTWNRDFIARPRINFSGFDGIDWDLEGNNAVASEWNHFTQPCLDLMGTMSATAHQEGFLVTLVPPESYFDVMTSDYDRALNHSYPEPWHPEFQYHGHNVYTYLLAKYTLDIFDLVDIQLYESYSHATYYINQRGQSPSHYLVEWVTNVTTGWMVNFENDPLSGLKNQMVQVDPKKLIVGFSFGNNGNGRTVFIWPKDVAAAWAQLGDTNAPRGVMFWNANLDQQHVMNGTLDPGYTLAGGFNSFLHVRDSDEAVY